MKLVLSVLLVVSLLGSSALAANIQYAKCSFEDTTGLVTVYIATNPSGGFATYVSAPTNFAGKSALIHSTGDLDATLSESTLYNFAIVNLRTVQCSGSSILNPNITSSVSHTTSNMVLTGSYSIVGGIIAFYENAIDCASGNGAEYSALGNIVGKCVIGVGNNNPAQTPAVPVDFTGTVGATTDTNTASYGVSTGVDITSICKITPTSAFAQNYPDLDASKVGGHVQIDYDSETQQTTVKAAITGFPVDTTHGIHLHTFGDLSQLVGDSVGGHWKNSTQVHNLPNNDTREYGDLGNFCYFENDIAYYTFTTNYIPVGSDNNFLGRAIALHLNRDNGSTTSFGARVAWCVIGNVPIGSPVNPVTIPSDLMIDSPPVCVTQPHQPTPTPTPTTTEDNFASPVQYSFALLLIVLLFSLL